MGSKQFLRGSTWKLKTLRDISINMKNLLTLGTKQRACWERIVSASLNICVSTTDHIPLKRSHTFFYEYNIFIKIDVDVWF